MANRIKGITVEIGGDTTKLQTALKGVNSEIRNTQSQLKDVDKLLKLDPGNTELLVQKQKLLSDAVSETKEKLATLKAAAEQANEALANGDISKEQYDALQREIIETEEALKSLEEQADKSATSMQKIAASGEKLKSAGDKVSSVGEKFLPATAVVTALGAAAVKTGAEFDSSMSKVAAVSGATGDDFDKLREKAREMGAKTKFSASEAAEAMNYMAMAGWKTEDMLNGIEGIMNLAAASGEDLALTSDIVTDALTAFGLTAADSGHFADIMAAASSNANTNVSMMGETFKYCAPVAGALGFSAEDTAEAIGLMANSGIKASQAGTALRMIMNNLTGDIEISGESLGDVTVATTNADGSMRSLRDILSDCREAFNGLSESEQAVNAKALFGTNAMSGFLALMNAAPSDIEKLEGAIDSCDGTTEKMADTMQDNLQGQLTILKSQLEELAISFADLMMPAIRSFVSMLQGLVDSLNKLPGPIKQVILVVALLVAAIGPLLIFIGKTMSAVGTIMTMAPKIASAVNCVATAIKGIATASTGISAVLKVFSGIGLVISGVVMAVKNFIDMFTNGFSVIKDILMGIGVVLAAVGAVILGAPALIAGVVAAIVYAVANLVIVIKEHWTEIGEFLANLWESIKTAASAAWQSLSESISVVVTNISKFLSDAWEKIKTAATSVWTSISTAVSQIVQTMVETITEIWNSFKEAFDEMLEAFRLLFETIFNAISLLVTTVMDAISQKVTEVWTAIQSTISAVLSAIYALVTNIWNQIKSTITTILNAIKTVISSVWNNIKALMTTVLNSIKTTVTTVWTNMKTSISTIIGQIYTVIKSGFDKAVSYIKGLIHQAYSWGRDMIMGIVDGIKSAMGAVYDAACDVADSISSVLHFSVPDEGPLTDYESWMPDFMTGLAKGIRESKGLITKAMSGVTSELMVDPSIGGDNSLFTASSGSLDTSTSSLIQSISDALGNSNAVGGDITIPVYIGQDRIDEIVVTAAQRANYRSGGR